MKSVIGVTIGLLLIFGTVFQASATKRGYVFTGQINLTGGEDVLNLDGANFTALYKFNTRRPAVDINIDDLNAPDPFTEAWYGAESGIMFLRNRPEGETEPSVTHPFTKIRFTSVEIHLRNYLESTTNNDSMIIDCTWGQPNDVIAFLFKGAYMVFDVDFLDSSMLPANDIPQIPRFNMDDVQSIRGGIGDLQGLSTYEFSDITVRVIDR